MSKKLLISAFLLIYNLTGYAQSEQLSKIIEADTSVTELNEVVITGTRFAVPIEKSGKTIYKLDRKEIEANRGKDITDLLNEIPGVQMVGNFGTPGTNISYRVRGAQSEQTLILIDGVPFNDPSGLAQTFDIRMLDLEQVESIEVLKGGLSSLYGTGAAAGVINITLKKAAKEKLKGAANLEYGSFNTFTSSANISGTTEGFSYMVSGAYKSSDGFSAALDQDNVGSFDDDGLESINFLGKFGYEFSDQFSINVLASVDDITTDFDGGAFRDNDSELEQQLLKFVLSPTYKWNRGSITGNFSYHTNERIFNSPSFSDATVRDISEFNGNTFQADLIVNQILTDQIKFVGGVNFQRPVWDPSDADAENFTMVDPYASLIFDANNFNVQVGGRLNYHSEYGANFVWNVNPSYLIDLDYTKLKLLGSYSTSFITPSLNQLHAGDFGFLLEEAGNLDLDPQESESVEVGFEFFRDSKFQVGTVYFYRKDKNLIDFIFNDDFTIGKYENIDGFTEVSGIEFNASYSFTPQITLGHFFTYQRSLTSDVILRRVPENKFGFNLSVAPTQNLLVKLTHLHVGEVPENAEIELDAYNLFDAFVSYTYKSLTFSGSINNIFDENYVALYGFESAARNYNVGVRYSF